MESPPLTEALFVALGRAGDAPGDRGDTESALGEVVRRGAAAWPDLSVAPSDFVRHLGERLASSVEASRDVLVSLRAGAVPEALHVDDLYLACACATGQSAAIARFERRYAAELGAVTRRFAGRGSAAEDLLQILRERLFVPRGDRPARIVEYRGMGTLRAWLRVTAVRAFLDERRRISRREKEEVGATEPLLDLPSGEDWELDFLKQHYRDAFKVVFAEAVVTLTSEQRNILRFHAVEGLTIDQIGAVYGMHRSSVARRLDGARKALLGATRSGLMDRIRVERTELDSIMGLIQSRLDVSLARLLAPSMAAPEGGEPVS